MIFKCRIYTEAGINRAVVSGKLLTDGEAIWILKKAIRIHDDYIRITWDDESLTGDDKLHEEWNAWYVGIINLIKDGYDALPGKGLITFDDAIDKLFYDSEVHQWYLDRPAYMNSITGFAPHHEKWRDRWLAILEVLKHKNLPNILTEK